VAKRPSVKSKGRKKASKPVKKPATRKRKPVLTLPGRGAKAASYRRTTGGHYEHKRTGKRISGRQYLNLQRGGVSSEAYAKDRRARGVRSHLAQHRSLVSDIQRAMHLRGVDISKEQIENSKAFRQIKKDLRSKDNSPGSRKAELLEAIGRRSPGAEYPVGDTPKLGRKRGLKRRIVVL
jgi:hypothetical protein